MTVRNIAVFCLVLIFMSMIIYLLHHQLSEFYAQSDPMLARIKTHISPLHPVVEDLNFYEGTKSYTINKQKIFLCLRDEHGEYYDFNMLIYVSIHELGHVLCDEIGHTAKFHAIFDSLLRQAAAVEIYDPKKPIIHNYCGHS
jgi:hypothetical protein